MGQKVNPVGYRLGVVAQSKSLWFATEQNFSKFLHQDIALRAFFTKKLDQASVSEIVIERPADNAVITIHTARPGVVVGKRGEDVEKLRAAAKKITGIPVHINIAEVKKPELNAKLVAEGISQQLVKRVMFRRAMKKALQSTMKQGALGMKICVSGRLGGAEIARSEWVREGRVPLHTLRADIDYAVSEAHTTYGVIGVKVWIFKGEVFDEKSQSELLVAGRASRSMGVTGLQDEKKSNRSSLRKTKSDSLSGLGSDKAVSAISKAGQKSGSKTSARKSSVKSDSISASLLGEASGDQVAATMAHKKKKGVV